MHPTATDCYALAPVPRAMVRQATKHGEVRQGLLRG